MSSVIEDRVLKMELDNSNFEANATKSMSTLDKLKEKLKMKDSSQGMEDLGKAVKETNLNKLAESAESVKVKFSALQVIGVTALTKIASSAVDAGEKLVKSLTVDQVTAGWDKYAEKTSAVQTIMAATAKDFDDQETQMAAVNAQLDKMMWYTDETSYSFNDMVSNVGKFTSNNVKLEDAVDAMMGISSWAAVSGANVNQASHAMYNLSQSIAMGSVRLTDWMSIENANMATAEFKETAIETALAMGTLKKDTDGTVKSLEDHEVSITSFRETLQDEWLTTDVLMETLKTYGGFSDELYSATQQTGVSATELLDYISQYKDGTLDMASAVEETGVSAETLDSILKNLTSSTMALGEKSLRAGQETKTFKEAIDATKDAVSSGWSQTFELIFGNYTEAKELWSAFAEDLFEIFVESGNERNELLSKTMNAYGEFESQLSSCGVTASQFEDALVEAAKGAGVPVDELIDKYGSLTDALQNGALSKNIVTDALDRLVEKAGSFTDGIKSVSDATQEAEANLEKFQNVVNAVINGEFSNGAERMQKLADAGYDYATVQGLVNTVWERSGKTWENTTITVEDLAEAIGDMSAEEQEALGFTEEQAAALADLAKQAKETGTPLNELIDLMMKPSGRTLFVDSLHNIMQGLLKTITVVKEAWADVMGSFTATGLYSVIEAFNNLTKKLNYSDETADKLKRTLKGVLSIVDLFIVALKTISSSGLSLLRLALSNVNVDLLDFTAKIGDGVTALHDWIVGLGEMPDWLKKIGSALETSVKKIKTWIQNNNLVPDSVKKLVNALSSGIEKIKEWWTSSDKLGSAISFLTTKFQAVKTAIQNFGTAISNTKAYQTVAEIFRNLWPAAIAVGMKAFSVLQEKAEAIGEVLEKVFSGRFDEIDISGFQNGLLKALEFAEGFKDDILEWFSGLWESIGDFISNVKSMDLKGFSLENAKAIFKEFCDTVISYMTDVENHWVNLRSAVGNVVPGLVEDIASIVHSVSGFAESLTTTKTAVDTVTKTITDGAMAEAAGTFHSFSQSVNETSSSSSGLQDFGENLKKFVKNLKKSTSETLDIGSVFTIGIYSAFIYGLSKAGKAIDKAGSFVSTQIGKFTAPLTALTELINGVKGTFGALTNYINTATKQLKYAHILEIAGAIAVLTGCLIALSLVPADKLKQGGIALLAIAGGLLAFTYLSSKIGSGAASITAAVAPILAIAGACVMLAAAINIIANTEIDDTFVTKMEALAGIILELGVIIGVIMGVLTKLSAGGAAGSAVGGIKAAGIVGSILAIGAAIALIANAMKTLAEIEIDYTWATKIQALEIIIGELGVVMMAVAGFASTAPAAIKGIGGAGVGFIGMAASLLILVKVLQEVDSMDLTGGIATVGKMTGLIVALVAMMAALGLASRIAGSSGLGGFGAGVGILAMATSLLVVIEAIKMLSNIPDDVFTNGADKLDRVSTIVANLMVVIGLLSGQYGPVDLGKNALKAGAALLLVSVAIGILAMVIAGLALIDPAGLERATVAIDSLMGCFALIIFATKSMAADAKGVRANLIIIAVIIALLAASLGALAMMDTGSLLAAAVSLVAVMAACATLFKSVSALQGPLSQALPAALLMVVALGSIAGALLLLANFTDPGEILADAIALSGCMLALAVALAAVKKVGEVAKSALQGALTLGVVMVAIAAALALASVGSPAENLANAAIMSATLLVLVGVMKVAQKAGSIAKQALVSIGILALVMTALGAAFAAMAYFSDGGEILQIATGLSDAILAISVACLLLSNVPVTAAMKAAADVAVFAGILIGAMGVFGEVIKLINDHTNGGADKAFESLGQVFGKLVGGYGKGVSSALPEIGANLAAFGESIAPFMESVKGIDAGAMEGVKNLGEALLTFTENDILNKINGFFSGNDGLDYAQLGKDLSALGEGVNSFIQTTQGEDVDTDKLQANLDVLKTLSEFQNELSETGGFLQDFTGVKDLGQFATELSTFADEMADFSTKIAGVTLDASEGSKLANVIDAAEQLIELQNSLEPLAKEGSIREAFLGDNGLGSFGEELAEFGTQLSTFAGSLTTGDNALTEDKINQLKQFPKLVEPLIELQNSLGGETVGGIVGAICGDEQDLGDFGSSLTTLGEGVAGLYTAMQGLGGDGTEGGGAKFDATIFEELKTALISLADVNTALQSGDGELDMKALSDFATGLPTTFDSLKMAFSHLEGIELEDGFTAKVDSITAAIQKFADIKASLDTSNAEASEAGATGSTLSGFGAQITSLCKSINEFATTLSDDNIKSADLEAAGTTLKTAIEKIQEAFSSITPESLSGLDTFAESMNTVVSGSISTAVTTFTEKATEMETAVTNFFSNIETAIDLGSTNLTSKFETMFNGLSTAAENAVSDFSEAGADITDAFKKGLDGGLDGLGDKFTSALDGVLRQAKAYGDNFSQVGTSICKGVSSGIKDSTSITTSLTAVLQSAATSVASSAVSMFRAVGANICRGVAAGISSNLGVVQAAAQRLIAVCQKAAAAAAEIQSPSKLFARTIGRYIPEGVAKGMDQNLGYVKDSSVKMAMATLDATRKALKINSPSLVFNEEVGRYIAEGIAEGIEDCTTPEEVAAKKAENIVAAFKEAIDAIDLKGEIRDLEAELFSWDNPDAAFTDAVDKILSNRAEEIEDAKKKVTFYEDQLTQIGETVGTEADEYLDAKKSLLTARKEYYSLLEEDISSALESATERFDLKGQLKQAEADLAAYDPTAGWMDSLQKAAEIRADDLNEQIDILNGYVDDLKNLEDTVEKDSAEWMNAQLKVDQQRLAVAQLIAENAEANYEDTKEYYDSQADLDTKLYTLYQSVGTRDDAYSAAEREIQNKEKLVETQLYGTLDLIEMVNKAEEQYGKASQTYQDLYGQLLDSLNDYSTAVNDLKEAVSEAGSSQKDAWKTVYDEINDGTDWSQKFIDMYVKKGMTVQEATDLLWDTVGERYGYDKTKGWTETISEVNDEAQNTLTALQDFVKTGNLTGVTDTLTEFASKFGESLTAGFRLAQDDVGEASEEICKEISGVITGSSGEWVSAGEQISNGIADGIRNGIDAVKDAIQEVLFNGLDLSDVTNVTDLLSTVSSKTSSSSKSKTSVVTNLGSAPSGVETLTATKTVKTAQETSQTVSEKKAEAYEKRMAERTTNVTFNQTNNSPKTQSVGELARLTKNALGKLINSGKKE